MIRWSTQMATELCRCRGVDQACGVCSCSKHKHTRACCAVAPGGASRLQTYFQLQPLSFLPLPLPHHPHPLTPPQHPNVLIHTRLRSMKIHEFRGVGIVGIVTMTRLELPRDLYTPRDTLSDHRPPNFQTPSRSSSPDISILIDPNHSFIHRPHPPACSATTSASVEPTQRLIGDEYR